MKTVGVIARHEDTQRRRNRRAVRCRRRRRAVHQPDVDGHLQDSDRHQGPMRDRAEPASRGGEVHHARRRGDGRGGHRAGAPAGAINWMTTVTLEGTQELMKHRDVAVILATGGMGLVRAAYSAGKPAYGVGPGNAPAYIERTRRREEGRPATSSPAKRSTTACSARPKIRSSWTSDRRGSEARVSGAGRLFHEQPPRWTRREGARHAAAAAEPGAGRQVGADHRREVRHHGAGGHARADRAARRASAATIPLSIEKLCPVLSFYVVKDWREGCERCKQILRYGGMGHTMSIHSQERAGHSRVRAQEAGVSHRRQHADHARVDWPYDRPRPGHDARMRRIRRQHHVRQHLAAAPAEHQTAGVRGVARRARHLAAGDGCAAQPAGVTAEALAGGSMRSWEPAGSDRVPATPSGRRPPAWRPRRPTRLPCNSSVKKTSGSRFRRAGNSSSPNARS